MALKNIPILKAKVIHGSVCPIKPLREYVLRFDDSHNVLPWLSGFQFPFGYLLQRLPTGRLLSVTIIRWRAALLSSPAYTSFAGMATNRSILRSLESAINPALVLLMSMWYTIGYQPLRLEACYSSIGIVRVSSGLIGYVIASCTWIVFILVVSSGYGNTL
jgi:hypothetical protein